MKFHLLVIATIGLLSITLQASIHSDIHSQIERDHIDYVRKTRGYPVYVTGGGMMGCVETIAIGFTVGKPRSVEEARRIIVPLIEHYMDLINRSRRIRPYLVKYPFPLENMRYIAEFGWQTPIGSNEVIQAVLLKGEVCYMFRTGEFSCEIKKCEDFAEAKRILEAEQREKTSQKD